jgi:GT2 family glycosyltransferase
VTGFLKMPVSPRIAAVFATMNRRQTAVTGVRRLLEQTRPPEWIVVADNVSTDGSAEAVEEAAAGNARVVVIRMPENEGNAGGIRAAMDWSFEQGADAVWVLDDDSWPRPEALARMLEHEWNPRIVRHPLQVDPQTGRFTWPLQVDDGQGGWRLAESLDDLPPGELIRTRIMWTGALIPREVREVVGPVNGALFIRGEDEEYPWRIERAGFTHQGVRAAVMDHPGPPELRRWRLLGKQFFFEPGLPGWKLYYKARNMIWLKRRQSGVLAATGIALAYVVATLVHGGRSRVHLAALIRAMRDGFGGRLGRAPESIQPR